MFFFVLDHVLVEWSKLDLVVVVDEVLDLILVYGPSFFHLALVDG